MEVEGYASYFQKILYNAVVLWNVASESEWKILT